MPARSRTWKCPKCGHRFATRNLWHSCGRYRIADHFRGKDPAVRRVWLRFARAVRACGRITIYAQKSRIVCMRDVRFAGAIARKHWLECGMWLDREIQHPALIRSVPLSRSSYGHSFRFDDPSQIDAAFESLLREAYACHAETARARRDAARKDSDQHLAE